MVQFLLLGVLHMPRKIQEKSRRDRLKTPHPAVIIACDAEKAEPIYFNHFKRQARNRPLQVVIVKKAAGKSYRAVIFVQPLF